MLSHQKATGTTESRFFSEATHCTRNLAVKIPWPKNPITSHVCTVVIALNLLSAKSLRFDGRTPKSGRRLDGWGGEDLETGRAPHQPGDPEQVDHHLQRP